MSAVHPDAPLVTTADSYANAGAPSTNYGSSSSLSSRGNTAAVSQLISNIAASSRVVVLRTSLDSLVATVQLSNNTIYRGTPLPPPTINPSRNAWREIRR